MSQEEDNEIISELQDEIHSLELSLSQIQREKHDLELHYKTLQNEHQVAVAELQSCQSQNTTNTNTIKELESDLLKTRSLLMINKKEFEDNHAQTDESEFQRIQELKKANKSRLNISTSPNHDNTVIDKPSPFNVDAPHSAPHETTVSQLPSYSKSENVSPTDLLDIIDLLKEENTILKSKIQHKNDVSYVKNRRTSLLHGGEIIL